MLYKEAEIVNGRFTITSSKTLDQSKLTSDCWMIQIKSLDACKSCDCINKKTGKEKRACGGKALRKKLLTQGV